MIDDPGVRSQRMEQITICIELEKYCAGADAMLRLRDMFNLTGDFLDIETLSKAVNICEISVNVYLPIQNFINVVAPCL